VALVMSKPPSCKASNVLGIITKERIVASAEEALDLFE
jgi:hypothetical protein